MSKTSSILNFWPKLLRFARFFPGKIENFGIPTTCVKDLTNSTSAREFGEVWITFLRPYIQYDPIERQSSNSCVWWQWACKFGFGTCFDFDTMGHKFVFRADFWWFCWFQRPDCTFFRVASVLPNWPKWRFTATVLVKSALYSIILWSK